MADVNDASNVEGKLENEWELLEAAAVDPDDQAAVDEVLDDWGQPVSPSRRRILEEDHVDERDYDAIRDFVYHRRDVENRAATTLINDLGNLRRAACWADSPLVEMSRVDVREFLGFLTRSKDDGGRGLDRDGMAVFGYKRVLRLLFEFMDVDDQYDDYEWWESIELPSQEVERVEEEKILSEAEVRDLKEAALNPRDKALIEFMADIGGRVNLVAQLRRKDVQELEGDEPYFIPNKDGLAQKDAPVREFPILRSRSELRTFMNRHHIDRRPEAPLWPQESRWYDFDDPASSAISTDRIRDMLEECAERAGIEGDIHPHMFRHTAMTRLSNSDRLTPQEIQHIAAWADKRMLEAYDQTGAQERNQAIQAATGYSDGVDDEDEPAEPRPCGNCRSVIGPEERFCANCGIGADRADQLLVQRAEQDVVADKGDTGQMDLDDLLDELFGRLKTDAEAKERLAAKADQHLE